MGVQDWGEHEGSPEVREEDQGAPVPERRGQEEPGPHVRPGLQAPAEDRNLQEADRGGRGDRRPQPGQVPQGPAGVGGDRGLSQTGRECHARLLLDITEYREYKTEFNGPTYTEHSQSMYKYVLIVTSRDIDMSIIYFYPNKFYLAS